MLQTPALLLLVAVSLQYCDGLLHFHLEQILGVKHVQNLGVVDLQEHACDLAGLIGLHFTNHWEELLSQHLLLFLGTRLREILQVRAGIVRLGCCGSGRRV